MQIIMKLHEIRERVRNEFQSQQLAIHILFFLRFFQLAAVCVSGFTVCWLIWQYNNHYCAWEWNECTQYEKLNIKVPGGLVALLCSVSLAA